MQGAGSSNASSPGFSGADACWSAGSSILRTSSASSSSLASSSSSGDFEIGSSLARPGGNMTGFVNFEHQIGGKWLDLLKDTAPGRNRIGVLFAAENPSQPA